MSGDAQTTDHDLFVEEARTARRHGLAHLLPKGHPARPPLLYRVISRWVAFCRRITGRRA